MILLFWDASALAKRYLEEFGADIVDALFSLGEQVSMTTTSWGYADA